MTVPHDHPPLPARAVPRPQTTAPDGVRARRPGAAWAERVAGVTGAIAQGVLAWLVVGLVLLPISPGFVHRFGSVVGVLNVPSLPSFFSIVLVGAVTFGLLRRLRVALWYVLVVWQGLSALAVALFFALWATGQAEGVRFDEVVRTAVSGVVAVVSIVVLTSARSAFPARLRRGALWPALGVLVIGVLGGTLVGTSLLTVWRGTLHDAVDRLRWSVAHATGLQSTALGTEVHGHGPAWIGVLIGLVSGLGLIAAIGVFLRSGHPDAEHRREDDLAVRELLLRYPGDSLGYFATRADRSTVFTADRQAAVSYRVLAGVCLAAGDPLGNPDRWPEAIERWLSRARTYGWVPAVTSTSEAGARAYQAAGLRPTLMGDEAVVMTKDFDLTSPAMRPVRRAVERPRAAGYTVKVRRQADVPADELAELVADAERWRHGEERGFSMALDRLGAAYDPREVVVSAHDADGAARGLLSFVPWERRGLSLDVMRRSPEAEAGVTELMVAELVAVSADLGVDRISLNFAVFRQTFEAGERIGATLRQRFNRKALRVASRVWQLESLYRSNEKYQPVWHPRLLCYEVSSQLPQVTLALGQAEGFVATPPRFFTRDDTLGARSVRLLPGYAQAVADQEFELLAVSAPTRALTQQQAARHAKLDTLAAAGMAAYPVAVPRTASVAAARAATAGAADPGVSLSVVGRVVRLRDLGGVVFAVLREGADQVQAVLSGDAVADLDLFRRVVDLGDQVAVTGTPGRSRSGEPSLLVTAWTMAAKALTPPPDKHRGLTDAEARVRLRHMDLALDDTAAHRLRARSAAVRSVRETLAEAGFVEVETPILQRIHGGANARPFRTHINAYDQDLYLRIAPELYLKRLAVGGVGRVFELGRNFRNEGADSSHNPEFTSMEAYQAYGDYHSMRLLTQQIVRAAAVAVHGEPVAIGPDGQRVRLDDGDWRTVTVHDAVSAAVGEQIDPDTPLDRLRAVCTTRGVTWTRTQTHGALVAELYDRFVEGRTVEPTFYLDFPVETSPLTRVHRRDPRLAERWDLVCFGAEIGTAYSELTDPVDQRRRLTQQSLLAAAGDAEAMELDEEFLAALEFGMPPTGGLGIGIDRMVMMLLGTGIRDVLTFPFVRPR